MSPTSDGSGLAVVAALAFGLGLVQAAAGTLGLLSGGRPPALVLAGAQAVLGLCLLPTGVGVLRRRPWGRALGVVAFGGVAVVQSLPLLAGATFAVPLVGIALATACWLWLLLAGGAFPEGGDDRALTEETDPHEFVR
ncbi:hypothetical protein [Haloarcula litorea]|uniref:hypothetical protein n=1 Tax=Haloarcula litorea TaxID=3032579 RepID=UPI0023E8AF60|nr:hypothetical protein [Halomicroarcula sp. GDY20]